MFYKMVNDLAPNYLSSLLPLSFQNTPYSLRDEQNIRPLRTRTQLYYKSFLPSSIRDWNNLSIEIRNSTSLLGFKHQLNKDLKQIPKYYAIGERHLQIQHTRLRTGCSSLNHDLFSKNITDSPLCTCGEIETTKHFLFSCPRYTAERNVMFNSLPIQCAPSLNLLLYGDSHYDNSINELIFQAVQQFIADSRRFSR